MNDLNAFRTNMNKWLREPEQHRNSIALACEEMAQHCERLEANFQAATKSNEELYQEASTMHRTLKEIAGNQSQPKTCDAAYKLSERLRDKAASGLRKVRPYPLSS